MNLLKYSDVEKYLSHQQVYFKKEICNIDFETIAEAGKVHTVNKVEVKRISDDIILCNMDFNNDEAHLYEYKTDLEFFSWIRQNFIPVSILIESYLTR